MVLDLRDTGFKYKTAANAAIYPKNPEAMVNKMAQTLDLDDTKLDKVFRFIRNPDYHGKPPNTPFPTGEKGITVREALTNFIDLQGALTKKEVKEIAELAEDEAEK